MVYWTMDFKTTDLLIFLRIYEISCRKEEKKKLTDTGLLEIPWILDVKGFSDG